MEDNILFKAAMPFVAAMILAAFMAFRRHDKKRRHRSFMQWGIYGTRRLCLYLLAINAGFDAGYLKYRRTLTAQMQPLDNEAELGLLLGSKLEAQSCPSGS